MELDEKNCIILDLLQKNCRMPLTAIAKEVGLSVDSTKKRIEKMLRDDVFFPKVQLRPRNFGFKNVVEVKIKFYNTTKEQLDKFIIFLTKHSRVVEIFSISGEYDMTIVIVARDAIEQGRITEDIRNRFGQIIRDWNESLTIKAYKFENYDMRALMKKEEFPYSTIG